LSLPFALLYTRGRGRLVSTVSAGITVQLDQLFIKRIQIEAEKLFRILVLAVLYTIGQHRSITEGRVLGTKNIPANF
jgi:hypothetical protein